MKTSKTPYEIRLDLLSLASQTLTQKYEAEAAQVASDSATEVVLVTKSPSIEDIIKEAEKLNVFVSQTTES